jgi:hypothetical protein
MSLAPKGGIRLTEPSLCSERRCTHIDTNCLEEVTKYAFAVGSSSMMTIPSFVKIVSGIQMLRGWRYTQYGDRIRPAQEKARNISGSIYGT